MVTDGLLLSGELTRLVGTYLVTGLVAGSVALLIALGSSLLWRRRLPQGVPGGGVLFALAGLVAISMTRIVPVGVWWGVGILAVGGAATRFIRPRWTAILLAAPGALLISAESVVAGAEWVRWFTLGVVLAGSTLASRFVTRAVAAQRAPVLFALFTVGVFLAVPDTEEALIVLGVAAPLALLSLPFNRVVFGAAGVYATVGLASWVIGQGGIGRPASIIGASACLGLLVVDPVARWLRADRSTNLDQMPDNWAGFLIVSVIQLLVVLAVSRTAGLVHSAALAAVMAAGLLMAVLAGLTVPTASTLRPTRGPGGDPAIE